MTERRQPAKTSGKTGSTVPEAGQSDREAAHAPGRRQATSPGPGSTRQETTTGAMSSRNPETKPKNRGYVRTFDSIEEYEQWLETNTDEPTLDDETPEQRFLQLAELSGAVARLNPRARKRFAASFDSFEDYETWKRDFEE